MRKVAKAIKGTSAHSINRKLHSHEAVRQEESFDHVLRSSESLDAKIDSVLQNPVRKGLVRIAREYPWSRRNPMDLQIRSRMGGIFLPSSRMVLLVTLICFMLLITLLPIVATISGKAGELIVLDLTL